MFPFRLRIRIVLKNRIQKQGWNYPSLQSHMSANCELTFRSSVYQILIKRFKLKWQFCSKTKEVYQDRRLRYVLWARRTLLRFFKYLIVAKQLHCPEVLIAQLDICQTLDFSFCKILDTSAGFMFPVYKNVAEKDTVLQHYVKCRVFKVIHGVQVSLQTVIASPFQSQYCKVNFIVFNCNEMSLQVISAYARNLKDWIFLRGSGVQHQEDVTREISKSSGPTWKIFLSIHHFSKVLSFRTPLSKLSLCPCLITGWILWLLLCLRAFQKSIGPRMKQLFWGVAVSYAPQLWFPWQFWTNLRNSWHLDISECAVYPNRCSG